MSARKSIRFVLIMLFICFSFAACGDKKDEEEKPGKKAPEKDYIGQITEDTIKMNGDGSLIEIACDDYSDVTFDYSSLENDIKKEIDDFNQKNGTYDVSFLQFSKDGSKIRVAVRYLNIEAYNKFNGTDYSLEIYDAKKIQNKYSDELLKEAEGILNSKAEGLSEGELAEAGIDLSALSDPAKIAEITGRPTTAVVKAADGKDVPVTDINDPSYMMLITNTEVTFDAGNGEVRYINDHGSIVNENTAKTDGKGYSAIVFTLGLD